MASRSCRPERIAPAWSPSALLHSSAWPSPAAPEFAGPRHHSAASADCRLSRRGPLTRPTLTYRLQVLTVLVSLLFSLLLYLALIAGSAWLCRWLVVAPWPERADRGYLFFRVAGIVCSGLLFLYLLRGLFKGTRQD